MVDLQGVTSFIFFSLSLRGWGRNRDSRAPSAHPHLGGRWAGPHIQYEEDDGSSLKWLLLFTLKRGDIEVAISQAFVPSLLTNSLTPLEETL